MQSKAATVDAYLASLPDDRRAAIQAVRKVFLDHIDPGYAEGMSYGMIGYSVPHSLYPAGYHCDPRQPLPFAGLASQKQHMSLYLMGCYGSPSLRAWFKAAWEKTGKKLDMGQACVRFKKVDDLALDVLAEAIRRMPVKKYVAEYESQRAMAGKGKPAKAKPAAKAPAARKPAARKPATKKPATKKAVKPAAAKGKPRGR